MALSSTSTYDQALAQFNDNLAWRWSATKAGALVEAALWLDANRPLKSQRQSVEATFQSFSGHEEVKAAREFLDGQEAGQGAGQASSNRTYFTKARFV